MWFIKIKGQVVVPLEYNSYEEALKHIDKLPI